MVIAGLARDFAIHQPARRLQIQHEHHGFQQAGMHIAALAGLFAFKQRHHHGQSQQIPRRQIHKGNARAHRPTAWFAGNGHHSAHALGDLVHAGALPIRPGLPEPRDGGIDQARIDRLQIFIGDAKAVLHLHAHVFNDNIGGSGKLHQHSLAFRRFQIKRDGTLIAVQVLEIIAIAVTAKAIGIGGGLHADHLGAPIGQMAHAGGASAGECQVQNTHASQGQARFGGEFGVYRAFGHVIPPSRPD